MSQKDMATVIVEAIRKAEVELPTDVIQAISDAYEHETDPAGKRNLGSILENARLARSKNVPMCQDTGIIRFFVDVGDKFPYTQELRGALKDAVQQATDSVPLRPNTVDPFSGDNPGNNLGAAMPIIHWDIVPGDKARILVAPKGGGSENASGLVMLTPREGLAGVKKAVLKRIVEQGGRPCPPIVVGLGIGGGDDKAMALGKKAALRPILPGEESELEKDIREAANALGVGPMGLGGDTTVLAVHVEYGYRHPASYPVGIVIQCWADRRAIVEVDVNGIAWVMED